MQLTKIIFTTSKDLLDLLKQKFSFTNIETNSDFQVFETSRTGEDGENEKIVLLYSSKDSVKEALDYAFKNYIIFKFINIGTAKNLLSSDLKDGDVIIPNTFLSVDSSKGAIFIDYAIGENYDLKKFGLILNGVCISGDLEQDKKEYIADIADKESYSILEELQKQDILDKTIIIKSISQDQDSLKNAISILEFVL